jgi:hypothetical protein
MNVLSSSQGSLISFMPLAIEKSVRERKSCAHSHGRIPEAIRIAPMAKNAPVITNNGSKPLRSFWNS